MITHPITGKSYIGATKLFNPRLRSHTVNLNGSKILAEDLRSYPVSELLSKILCVGSYDYVFESEDTAIQVFATRYPNGYNLAIGGKNPGWSGVNNHPLIGEWRRAATEAASAVTRGVPRSFEFKEKLSIALQGHEVSTETRQKISLALLGRTLSGQHRALLSRLFSGSGNPFFGKRHTEEARIKMRGPRGRWWTREDGSSYVSAEPENISDMSGRRLGRWWTASDGTSYIAEVPRAIEDRPGRPSPTTEQRERISQAHRGTTWSEARRRAFLLNRGIE
jgi:hypothetical protein